MTVSEPKSECNCMRSFYMKNIPIKRIIVAFASVSLLFTTAFFSGCDDGKNYEEEMWITDGWNDRRR